MAHVLWREEALKRGNSEEWADVGGLQAAQGHNDLPAWSSTQLRLRVCGPTTVKLY